MNEQTLFLRALEQPAGELRQEWLERECEDQAQRSRIASLLQQHEGAGDFLQKPPAELLRQVERPAGFQFLASTSSKPISKAKFVDRLIRSNLLTEEEVSECDRALEPEIGSSTAPVYAEALVQANVLTGFQAKAIYEGRIKGLTFGEYIILDQLGKGGMGIVYRAKHRRMDRLVAIKVLPRFATATKGMVDRFYREVKTAGRLMHPNIVSALDASEDDGLHYLVMEYVEGQDLRKVLERSGPLQIQGAVDCVIQAARGLQYAHEQGVIHRDIKPANLLLDANGIVKILDMGLARVTGAVGEEFADRPETCSPADAPSANSVPAFSLLEESAADPGETRLTKAGEVMGTLDYMSPEQFTDSRSVDERGDIYSLGCTLYRLMTASRPFSADSANAIFLAHRSAPIPSLRSVRSDVPKQLDTVFQRMLAKDPVDRQDSMSQVIGELEESMNGYAVLRDTVARSRLPGATLASATANPVPGVPVIAFRKSRTHKPLRRQIPVGWIALAGLGVALLLAGTATLLDHFSKQELTRADGEEQTKQHVGSAGDIARSNPQANATAAGIREAGRWLPKTKANADDESDPKRSVVRGNPLNPSTSHIAGQPHSPHADERMAAAEPDKGEALNQTAAIDTADPSRNAPGKETTRTRSSPGFSWSDQLSSGVNSHSNRFVEFIENGKRVSITEDIGGITVASNGKVVSASSPNELKNKDAQAYLLYEKMLGLPDQNLAPSASTAKLQRNQLKQLLRQQSAPPLLNSLIERMLPQQND